MHHQEVCPIVRLALRSLGEADMTLRVYSVFLGDISAAYKKDAKLENLLFDDFFNKASAFFLPSRLRFLTQLQMTDTSTPLVAARSPQGPTRMEVRHRTGSALGYPDARLLDRFGLLRRLQNGTPTRQSFAGATRLLWCAHVQDSARVCQREM